VSERLPVWRTQSEGISGTFARRTARQSECDRGGIGGNIPPYPDRNRPGDDDLAWLANLDVDLSANGRDVEPRRITYVIADPLSGAGCATPVDDARLRPQNASMAVRVMSWLWRPRLLRMLFSQMRLTGRLLREPRVPLTAKVVPMLAALYLVSPLDFIPDLFPLIGQLDDVTLSLIALATFLRMCPAGPVAFHRGAIAEGRPYSQMSSTDDVIDAEWRREQ
jgi:uncharacterized membrane protein YkvA (DUF1232 family)